MRKISYTWSALKTLRRMPAPTRNRIKARIEAYADDPTAQANDLKAMKVGLEYVSELEIGGSSWMTKEPSWPCWKSVRAAGSTADGGKEPGGYGIEHPLTVFRELRELTNGNSLGPLV